MNILITAIGSMSADSVISSLNNLGHKIIGCDIYPKEFHAISKDCKKVYLAPLATDDNSYIKFLLDVIYINKINYLIPLTDPEVDVINKNRNKIEESGVIICMPNEEAILVARNKFTLFEKFKNDDNVPTINTYRNKDLKVYKGLFPCVAKPANGRSSEGLVFIYTREELDIFIRKDGYIIQEFIDGPLFTVDYVRNAETGNDFAIPREELLRTKNGAGITVKVKEDSQLQRLVSYIGNKLEVNGCINMEFIKHKRKFYLIDINPRFSAGVAFSSLTGYNMVESHLNCFSGKDILHPVKIKEQIMTKRYKEEIL